jgi:hypothetical protein
LSLELYRTKIDTESTFNNYSYESTGNLWYFLSIFQNVTALPKVNYGEFRREIEGVEVIQKLVSRRYRSLLIQK